MGTQGGYGMELRPDPVGLRLCSDLRGLVFGSFDSRTQRGWVLSRSDPRGLGPSVSGPKGVSIWVLRCQDQKGVGVGPYPDPRGVGGWVYVWTQRGWSLGSSMSDPRDLGLGPSIPNPSWFGGWVVSKPKGDEGWAGGDPRGLGDGSMSRPKWGGSTSASYGVGVLVLWWPDPRGLGPFASRPKGFGFVRAVTQGGLTVGSVSGPKGFGVWVFQCST